MDGLVDIYMPDMKYTDAPTGNDCRWYEITPQSIKPPCGKCTGSRRLATDAQGLARRGLPSRHLVLPAIWAGPPPSRVSGR
jgi:putative pyruvate formate lyase activating enzyme